MKKRELSHEERLTVKMLRENGHSFPKLIKLLDATFLHTLKHLIHSKNCSIHQKQGIGKPKKFNERGKNLCAELQGRHDSQQIESYCK